MSSKKAAQINDPFADGSEPLDGSGLSTAPVPENQVFLDNYRDRITRTLKEGERGTFVETALSNPEGYVELQVEQGQLIPYTRISDLAGDLDLLDLDNFENQDLVIHTYDQHETDKGPFMTLECSLLSDPSKGRFLTNCGGSVAQKKILAAFAAVAAGKAIGPLVGRFNKIITGSGNSFWQLT